MSEQSAIGVGIIGMGFMGKTHLRAYMAAANAGLGCTVVAACDGRGNTLREISETRGNLRTDISKGHSQHAAIREYTEVEEILGDADVQIVSVCTYTDTHVEYAIKALEAGKHVLVEKPVAVRAEDVQRLVDVARGANTLCMPAMCMRFWPGWDWLKARIDERAYGALKKLTFTRLGSGPDWAQSFYQDERRSGGALVDLHIHDVDYLYWCIGKPREVRSRGSARHVHTEYTFGDQRIGVTAEGGWTLEQGDAFQMKYAAEFERASVSFELGRTPALVVKDSGGSHAVELREESGYEAEIRHFVSAVRNGDRTLRATMEDAAAVAEVLEAERASLERGGEVIALR